jgi:hypothetical protein
MEAAKDEKVTLNESEDTTATESLNTSGISSGADSVEDAADFTEEEAKKAEEYKTKGNDFFKCKYRWASTSV